MGRDVHADAIVKKAHDTKVSLSDRAIQAVKSIVREYYDESLLSDVTFRENEPGLSTTPVGKGKELKGKIFVGKYFIEYIDAALGYFNCLTPDDQKAFATKQAELLKRREVHRNDWEFVPGRIIQEPRFLAAIPTRRKFQAGTERRPQQSYLIRIEIPRQARGRYERNRAYPLTRFFGLPKPSCSSTIRSGGSSCFLEAKLASIIRSLNWANIGSGAALRKNCSQKSRPSGGR